MLETVRRIIKSERHQWPRFAVINVIRVMTASRPSCGEFADNRTLVITHITVA
jgi:hypothetical protein